MMMDPQDDLKALLDSCRIKPVDQIAEARAHAHIVAAFYGTLVDEGVDEETVRQATLMYLDSMLMPEHEHCEP